MHSSITTSLDDSRNSAFEGNSSVFIFARLIIMIQCCCCRTMLKGTIKGIIHRVKHRTCMHNEWYLDDLLRFWLISKPNTNNGIMMMLMFILTAMVIKLTILILMLMKMMKIIIIITDNRINENDNLSVCI